MAYIEMRDVSFEYPGGFLAVDNINIRVEKGENLAIVGQNGAGKTTTVKMLNGLHRPSKGDVIIGDMNTKDHTTAQVSRVVGYVFQNPDDQIFHSTVLGEVEFGPKMMGLDEETLKKQVDYALEITGMEKFREENPYNLPLSTRKFVTIAAIIALCGYYWLPEDNILDPILSLPIAIMVVIIGVKTFSKSARELTDHAIPAEKMSAVLSVIETIVPKESIKLVRSRIYSEKFYLDLIVFMDPNTSLKEADDLSDRIKKELFEKFDDLKDVYVGIEPDDEKHAFRNL